MLRAIREEGEYARATRTNAETFDDRLRSELYRRTAVRSVLLYIRTPKVTEEAPTEGDRAPPTVADPARCTESSTARAAVIYPILFPYSRSVAVHDTVVPFAGGTVMHLPWSEFLGAKRGMRKRVMFLALLLTLRLAVAHRALPESSLTLERVSIKKSHVRVMFYSSVETLKNEGNS